MPAYYFGCVDRVGHYLWERRHGHLRSTAFRGLVLDGRWLDGGFCPPDDQPEGAARLTQIPDGGWADLGPTTVLAFWDRSVDHRYGSNSTFLLPGILDHDAAVDAARAAFPEVLDRLDFEVTPWTPGVRDATPLRA